MYQDLKKATKQSLYENKVAQLDFLGSNKDEYIFEDEMTLVERLAGEFIDRVKVNLEEADAIVSGKIADLSIETRNNEVLIYANPWLIYQDRGVNGAVKQLYDTPHQYHDKRPPVGVFIAWVKEKNVQLRDNATYYGKESPFKDLTEEEQIERVAYAIREKVFQEGFKPRNVYSKEIPELIEDLENELTGFALQQIVQKVDFTNQSANRIILK